MQTHVYQENVTYTQNLKIKGQKLKWEQQTTKKARVSPEQMNLL